ncbi:MAG: DUF418 domain-containing protein, partial [Egibacteraceae bacterium]
RHDDEHARVLRALLQRRATPQRPDRTEHEVDRQAEPEPPAGDTAQQRAVGAGWGLGLGLPVNLVLGPVGPLWGGATLQQGAEDPGVLVVVALVQLLGAPLLASGYLAGVALLALRVGPPQRLAAVGRMALSAYLAQRALALVVFAGFGLYETLGSAAALLVVAGIWALLLVACPLWLRRFRYGPVEWLWRTATYGQRQPLRAR